MENIDDLLGKLNNEQIKPVTDTEGAVLVVAGAGSGKTRVLTTRIAYLVMEKGVNPYEILAITFTNKAAEEMKNRLKKIIGDIGDMWVCTIHSMCVRILRRNIDRLGYDSNFTIYDETDKDKALKRIIEDLDLPADKLLKTVKNHISIAKNECLSPEEYKAAYSDVRFIEEIYAVYSEYEKVLARSNSLDFDDLLYKTYTLFVNFPDIADSYSQRFKYIHIDEFQDTNKVQFAIAQRLSIKHGNIFVVGDDDQSIYGWRGAKIENILNFDDIYRGAKIYKLEQNYRSSKKILELANCIIANNTERRDKKLWTDNPDGVKIETFVGTDENSEAAFAAASIKNLMARTNLRYKDFAVFMRVNALSRAFEQEFTKYAIPYKVFGGFRFFERKEIKDVLSYLKLVNNPFDDEAFFRAVSVPKRGIGDKTLLELKEFAYGAGLSVFHAIDRLAETTISPSARKKLANFKSLIEEFIEFSNNTNIIKTLDNILETTGFMDQFEDKSEENTSRIMNINELKNSIEQFVKENGETAPLAEFLNSVTLSSDTDELNSDDVVTVATIHAVKGLEYEVVFVAGLDEKILPVMRNSSLDEDLEEERRLMYVAVTRARQRLYLTRAMSRYLYGSRENMVQSRFLKEAQPVLNPNYTERKNEYTNSLYGSGYKRDYTEDDFPSSSSFSGGYSSSYAKTMLKSEKPKEKTGVNSSSYKVGVKVKHVKFGEGMIISVKGVPDNLVVDVAFKGIGIKSLSVKYAPMEIVG